MKKATTKNYRKAGLKDCIGMLSLMIILCQLAHQSVLANTTAKNRNDVYQILSKLDTELELDDLDIWINEKAPNPSITIGNTIYFTMKSNEPVFYTLIHVDSKGNTVLINPATAADRDKGSDYIVYPPLVDGCKVYDLDERCYILSNQLVQSKPIGQDAVFLLASKEKIPYETLGMNESDDFKLLGKEIPIIEDLVQRINSQSNNNPISVVKYTYAVESENTQYTTRAISKKVNEVAEGYDDALIFNNINFAFNSSELTVRGFVELDGLGSALVGMQEQLGAIPVVELTGHTDSVGSESYNLTLSKQRAESAKQYLVAEHGLPVDAIRTAWKGENEPMDSNDTKKGRAMNRRVVLRIPNSGGAQ